MAIDRDPFTYDRDSGPSQETEFSHGRGMFPDPRIDFDPNGIRSGIPRPVGQTPTRNDMRRLLMSLRRTDVNDPAAQPDPYVCGNTDRYGAQPPLVRETRRPKAEPRQRYARPRMQRQW